MVFVNLGYSKLDIAANDLEKALVVDSESGKIKATYALDMADNDLLNVRNILSKSGKWSLDENGKLFVEKIETERIEVKKPYGITIYDTKTGEPMCVVSENRTLKSIAGKCEDVENNPVSTETAAGGQNINSDQSANLIQGIADTEPPAITINGNNPAMINVGASYADLGASVTDNTSKNLGISFKVDGVEVNEITLDTSKAGEYTITYTATDEAGNTGTATRKVIVYDVFLINNVNGTSTTIN